MDPVRRTDEVVLIVDPDARERAQLAASFGAGWRVVQCASVTEARALMARVRPTMVVVELQLGDGAGYDLAEHASGARLVLLSAQLSVAAVVRAHALGFASVALKPITAAGLLSQLDAPPIVRQLDRPMSLERALWEYTSRYVATLPTRRAAAQRLGLQPRSLRRMLARYPPAR